MFHQIRQAIRPGNIGGAKPKQMQFHRAMRTHRTACGRGAAWREVNFTFCPRHQPAQPKP